LNGRFFWVSEEIEPKTDATGAGPLVPQKRYFIQWVKNRNHEYVWSISPMMNKLAKEAFMSYDDRYSPHLLHDWKIMKDGKWLNGKSVEKSSDKCKVDILVQIKKA